MTEPHPNPETMPRRGFFQKLMTWTTYAAGAVAAAAVGVPFVGYLLGPLRKDLEKWVDLGPLDDFKDLVGETRLHTFPNPLGQPWDGKAAKTGVYVRYQGPGRPAKEQFVIFAMNCAHLGCPVSWFPQSGLFMCPCHGGVYYASGKCASGPPPRGLFQCDWRITRAVRLEVKAPHYPTLQDTLRPEDRS
ncbi:MAG TPA: Rieske 2Fe-2S domain-containing protein [Gemmataceae bacterium]|nr:Rieske 2Fe-2S domain-containing protein [Gemmataceae bacterium]